LFIAVLAFALPAHALPGPNGLPDVKGPDIPTLTAPDHVITVFERESYTCTEQDRTRTIDVPAGEWDRIILEVTHAPKGDPWDRLFMVAIGGVEVLRGTSPRTEMTLRKDITEYATLLPAGGTADVTLTIGTYVGTLEGTVKIEWYGDEPTGALVRRPASNVQPIFYRVPLPRQVGLEIIREAERDVTFGATPPDRAIIEMTMSSHGRDEVWFQNGPLRGFHVYVDDVEVANIYPHPYRYAFFGFGNENANTACVGPGTSSTGDLVHGPMWWTAQRVADAAGVHTGPGEILSHRWEVDASLLPLFTGERTVRMYVEGGWPYWPISVAIVTP
jgi:hypothetical protein